MPIKCPLWLSNYPKNCYYFALHEKDMCPLNFSVGNIYQQYDYNDQEKRKSHRQDNAVSLGAHNISLYQGLEWVTF